MTTTETRNQIRTTLGERLRARRHDLKLSQQMVASPEFTKSYISAVERGKANPSLKALELVAGRLGMRASDLLAEREPTPIDPDVAALEEDVAYQLDCARRAIDTNQGDEALRLISAAERQAGNQLGRFTAESRFRVHYLRAGAYLRLGEPESAHPHLAQAAEVAAEIRDNGESVERVRNAQGAAYFQQDLPPIARDYHERGLHAIQAGAVQDPNLQLLIYSNLASDYWALGETEQAISTYKLALGLLDSVNNLDRQSSIYWGLSLAHQASGDLVRAKLYAARALDIYEAAHNQTAAAQMSINLAQILTDKREYGEAAAALDRARLLLESAGDGVMLSIVHQRYASLALAQDHVADAAGYSARALALSRETVDASAGGQQHAVRTYVRALRLAGQVAEAQGDQAAADAHFVEAISRATAVEYRETASDIAYSYAELLRERGDHEQAGIYYRDAFQQRTTRGPS